MRDHLERQWLARLLRMEGGASGPWSPLRLDASQAIESALSSWGGALLVDEVGLGRVQCALSALSRRQPGLLCAPESAHGMWAEALDGAGLLGSVRLCSPGLLALEGQGSAALVVVDEAQRFTDPSTARSRALARLGAAAPCILLTTTASPIGVDALIALVRCFLPVGAFEPMLGRTLEEHIAAEGERPDLAPLLRTVLIHRSRGFISCRWPKGLRVQGKAAGPLLFSFPQTVCTELSWSVAATIDPGPLVRCIERLDGAAMGLSAGLLRGQLLLRLESSPAALAVSLRRLEAAALASLEGGGLDPRLWRRAIAGLFCDDTDLRAAIPRLVGDNEGGVDALERQLGLLREATRRASAWSRQDVKCLTLLSFLRSLAPRQKVVVLTRSRDAALALLEELVKALPGAWVGGVVRRAAFAGRLRARPSTLLSDFVERRSELSVLVATDALAHALDLSGVGTVVSYDLLLDAAHRLSRHGRFHRFSCRTRPPLRLVSMVPDSSFMRASKALKRAGASPPHFDRHSSVVGALGQDAVGEGAAALHWVEHELQADLLSLASVEPGAQLPPGWAMRSGARTPAGTLFLLDIGVEGALSHWVFVPSDEAAPVVTDRRMLYHRLVGVSRRPCVPLLQADARAMRHAIASALEVRRRLLRARLVPRELNPQSPAGRVFKMLSQAPLPLSETEALVRRASALRVLASARPVWRSAILEDALERQTPLDEIVDHLVSQSTESQWGEGQVKVMGFVDFVSVEVSASRRGR